MQPPPKTRPIALRLTDAERLSWDSAAASAGLSRTDFIRDAVQVAHPALSAGAPKPKKRKQPLPPKGDPALIAELARLGNNLNQLARAANSRSAPGALGLLVALRSIEVQLREALARCS